MVNYIYIFEFVGLHHHHTQKTSSFFFFVCTLSIGVLKMHTQMLSVSIKFSVGTQNLAMALQMKCLAAAVVSIGSSLYMIPL